jgi:hypothetical protein
LGAKLSGVQTVFSHLAVLMDAVVEMALKLASQRQSGGAARF